MIDIGANLTNRAFASDQAEVLRRAEAAGVTAIVVTGTSVEESQAALALAEGNVNLFATAGVHPHDAGTATPGWDRQIATLAEASKVVAIGETGLDFFRNYSPKEAQLAVFRRQVELAAEAEMPLFVHDRDSAGETGRMLRDYQGALAGCVIHCFTGTEHDLEGYLADGHHIGITGWICDERRGSELASLVRRIPRSRLMIETDAPYLLPRTMRPRPRSRRNEPAFLTWVAAQVAACRGEDVAEVAQYTAYNAARLFGLPSAVAQIGAASRRRSA